MKKLALFFYDFFLPRRKFLFTAVGILFASLLFITSRLILEENIMKILPGNQPELARMRQVMENFHFSEKIFILINSDTGNLQACTEFASALELYLRTNASDYLESVQAEADESGLELFSAVRSVLPALLDEKDLSSLESYCSPSEIEQSVKAGFRTLLSPAGAVFRKIFISDPIGLSRLAGSKLSGLTAGAELEMYNGYFFTKDRKYCVMFVNSLIPSQESARNKALLNILEQGIKKTKMAFPGVNCRFHGMLAAAVCNADRIKKDISLTVSIATIFIILLIFICIRRFSVLAAILFSPLFGISASMALFTLFKNNISAVAVGLGSVIVGITVDYPLHFYNHYKSRRDMRQVIRDLAGPVSASALTTICAFLCLLLVRSEALFDMGIFVSISILFSMLATFIVLPHIIDTRKQPQPLPVWLQKISSCNFEKYLPVLALTALLGGAAVYYAPKIKFLSDLSGMNYLTREYTENEKVFNEIFHLDMQNINTAASADNLEDALSANDQIYNTLLKLQAENKIEKFFSIAPVLNSRQTAQLNSSRWISFWTPQRRNTVRGILENSSRKLGLAADIFRPFYEFISSGSGPLDINSLSPEAQKIFPGNWISTNNGIMILNTVRPVPGTNFDLGAEMEHIPGVITVNKREFMKTLISAMQQEFFTIALASAIVIFIILLISFGTLRAALAAFIPIVLSWIMTLGFMSFLKIYITPFNIIVSIFIFGLGVDYCIFIVQAARERLILDIDHGPSYRASVLLSAATTLFGFGALVFARHPALQSIGVSAVIGISAVLLNSFVTAPFLTDLLIGGADLLEAAQKISPREACRLVARSLIPFGPAVRLNFYFSCRREKNYSKLNELLPERGQITELGSSRGFASLMLFCISPARKISLIDINNELLTETALNRLVNDNFSFICKDPAVYKPERCSAIFCLDAGKIAGAGLKDTIVNCCLALDKGGIFYLRVLTKNRQDISSEMCKQAAQETGLYINIISLESYTEYLFHRYGT